MPTGRVKFFNTERGYGFIAPDGGGSDVFVHVHEVEAAGMKMLVAGQLVTTRSGPGGMGAQKPSICGWFTRAARTARCSVATFGRRKPRPRGRLIALLATRGSTQMAHFDRIPPSK